MTKSIAGKLDGVPFFTERDGAGAVVAFTCASCGMETAPEPDVFMKKHGPKCRKKTEKKTPAKKS